MKMKILKSLKKIPKQYKKKPNTVAYTWFVFTFRIFGFLLYTLLCLFDLSLLNTLKLYIPNTNYINIYFITQKQFLCIKLNTKNTPFKLLTPVPFKLVKSRYTTLS